MPKKTKPATADRLAAAEAAARRAAAAAAAAEYPEHLLTIEQVLALAEALTDAVHRHVTDKAVLRAIRCDLARSFARAQGADPAELASITDERLDELLRLAEGGRP